MHWFERILCTAAVCLAAQAQAAGLSISPVNLFIQPGQKTTLLKLHNTSKAPMNLQVRVKLWQTGDRLSDQYVIVASPPALRLPPDGRQLVRIVNTGAPAVADKELAYRLLLDEVPNPDTPRGSGLLFQMRYSLPLFVGGPPLNPSIGPQAVELARLIEQQVRYRQSAGTRPALVIVNPSAMHARVAKVRYRTGNGDSRVLVPGLLGYALAGETATFPIEETLPADAKVIAEVNGVDVTLQAEQ